MSFPQGPPVSSSNAEKKPFCSPRVFMLPTNPSFNVEFFNVFSRLVL